MMDLTDYAAPRYPASPGHRGVDTSVRASAALAPQLGNLQAMALAAIRAAGSNGLTTHEVAATLNLDLPSIQPRPTELKKMGKVKDSGFRRRNASGKSAIVWVAVDG